MYFTHPQVKLNRKNLKALILSFLKRPDAEGLKNKLSSYFPGKKIVFTDMGRSAFRIIVEKMELKNTTMLVPAFLCDIFYPLFKDYNIQPIFLDADLATFNLKLEEIEKKIKTAPDPNKIKSILVSHIFGLANDMEKILGLAKKNNLRVIEDCAHAFGTRYQGQYLGNFGEASLFSLYKIFPCFRGGILVCPPDWTTVLKPTSFNWRDYLSFLNCFPSWAYIFKKFGSAVAPKIARKEKTKEAAQINKVSLNLFSFFWKKQKEDLNKRIELALSLQQGIKTLGFQVQDPRNNGFCYVSGLMPEALPTGRQGLPAGRQALKNQRNALVKEMRKYKIFATRMWHTPLALNRGVQKEYNLDLRKFPHTKEISQRIINFPLQNFYTARDIEKIIQGVKKALSSL